MRRRREEGALQPICEKDCQCVCMRARRRGAVCANRDELGESCFSSPRCVSTTPCGGSLLLSKVFLLAA